MTRNEELDTLRKEMGTLPNDELKISSKIHKGVSGISVELLLPAEEFNPYKLIFENTVATWGDEDYKTKWNSVSPENRFKVVLAALTGQTLPQSLESVTFSFIVRGVSRSAFDQHARQRFATFFSQGVRDNSRLDAGFRIPSELWNDEELIDELKAHFAEYKRLYKKILERGEGSFQSARCVMPMGATHNYKFSANVLALKSYMAQRLKACEQADTVATAIAVRKAVEDEFPLLGSVFRPGCDYAKKCQYHQSYSLSEMFGCLFRGCGRWKDETPYATFNRSCTDYKTIEQEMGFTLPKPNDIVTPQSFDELNWRDRLLFEEDYDYE